MKHTCAIARCQGQVTQNRNRRNSLSNRKKRKVIIRARANRERVSK